MDEFLRITGGSILPVFFLVPSKLKMAVQSKAEINLRRLLAQCETMANEIKSNDGRINWRLEKVSYPFIINI
jgi:hypothetical protein